MCYVVVFVLGVLCCMLSGCIVLPYVLLLYFVIVYAVVVFVLILLQFKKGYIVAFHFKYAINNNFLMFFYFNIFYLCIALQK